MTSKSTLSYVLATLVTCALTTGCAGRPKPADVALSVESSKPGTEYHVTGSVDLDGKRTAVDQKTPYRFTGNGLETNAKIVSKDADCNLLAKFESGADRDLTSQAIGPVGCEVTLTTKYQDRISSTQIVVKALPSPAAAPTPVAAPVTAPQPEATPAPAPVP